MGKPRLPDVQTLMDMGLLSKSNDRENLKNDN